MLATLSASRTEDLAAAGESTAAALTGGYQLAYWIGTGLVVTAIAVAALVIEREPERAAHEAARRARVRRGLVAPFSRSRST